MASATATGGRPSSAGNGRHRAAHPVGVETYALRAWLLGNLPERARRFEVVRDRLYQHATSDRDKRIADGLNLMIEGRLSLPSPESTGEPPGPRPAA